MQLLASFGPRPASVAADEGLTRKATGEFNKKFAVADQEEASAPKTIEGEQKPAPLAQAQVAPETPSIPSAFGQVTVFPLPTVELPTFDSQPIAGDQPIIAPTAEVKPASDGPERDRKPFELMAIGQPTIARMLMKRRREHSEVAEAKSEPRVEIVAGPAKEGSLIPKELLEKLRELNPTKVEAEPELKPVPIPRVELKLLDELARERETVEREIEPFFDKSEREPALKPVPIPTIKLHDVREPSLKPVPIPTLNGIGHDIAERVRSIEDSGRAQTFALRLDPPELGEILLKVAGTAASARAEITAESDGLRHNLEVARSDIVAAVESKGIVLDSLNVRAERDAAFSQDPQQNQANHDQPRWREPHYEPVEGAHQYIELSAEGLDLKV